MNEALKQNVQFVKGVGPDRARLFEKLGVQTVEDLLYLLPRDHDDLRRTTLIRELAAGENTVVEGRLEYVDGRVTRSGVPVVEAAFLDSTGSLTVVWFHRPTVADHFRLGQRYWITGKPKRVDGHWRMANPKIEPADTATGEVVADTLVPTYPLTEGLHPEAVRRAVRSAVEQFSDTVAETLPESLRRKRDLPSIGAALRGVHFPSDPASLERARTRLVYDEFLVLQTALAVRRAGNRRQQGWAVRVTPEIDRRIRRLFPFKFTSGQDHAVTEICRDLDSTAPMYRLLQGDVGCGKTAVALYAVLATVANGMQAALMAPTEVLARQHAQTLDDVLSRSRVRRLLLTGSLKPSARSDNLERMAEGAVDVVVGTHSLIQKDVQFAKLGLVVIDEQHKFGVRQRAGFQRTGHCPHHLVMTATPIPRSLAMTWYGDLELTTIADRPAGRRDTLTRIVPTSERERAYVFLEKSVRTGMSGLVMCPRIETDEQTGYQSVIDLHAEMTAGRFRDLDVGIVHGRMNEAERDMELRRFRRGDVRVLVCTVVLEVGVDIPQANIVLVENAELFGLSQLHQIRGRVGRGDARGVCLLLSSSDDPGVRDRLQCLAETNDGFQIAEMDAQMRGIGEPIGDRQHGFVAPRIGDYLRDREILQQARQDAQAIVAADPSLTGGQWANLRQRVLQRFGKTFGLALIG